MRLTYGTRGLKMIGGWIWMKQLRIIVLLSSLAIFSPII